MKNTTFPFALIEFISSSVDDMSGFYLPSCYADRHCITAIAGLANWLVTSAGTTTIPLSLRVLLPDTGERQPFR